MSESLLSSFLMSDVSQFLRSLTKNEQPWAIRSKIRAFAHSLSFGEVRERFAHGRSFLVSDLSESLILFSLKKRIQNIQKTKILATKKNLWIANWLIYHERPERFAHSHSFDMSDLSNSLTVAHLSWAIWANRSQSLIWFEQNERMRKMSEWANEQMSEFPALSGRANGSFTSSKLLSNFAAPVHCYF